MYSGTIPNTSYISLVINVLKDNIRIKQMIKLIYSKIDEEIQKNLYNDKNKGYKRVSLIICIA